jgi:tetratricopeptide (TPR) repeat protein
MKISRLAPILLTASMFVIDSNCIAQNAATVADAKQYYQLGIASYNRQDYESSIAYFLVSLSQVPANITYYAITNAYARFGNYKLALIYANRALAAKPPLEAKYVQGLQKIKTWAINESNAKTTPQQTQTSEDGISMSTDLLRGNRPSPNVEMASENLFNVQPQSDNSTTNSVFQNKVVYSTNQPQYRATVTDNNNNIVGYIIFYGFTNGRNINGQTIASTFSIPLRRVIDNEHMEWGNIEYKTSELYPGSVKTKTIGRITFKTIIIKVKKYDVNNYYLNSITLQVTASVQ